MLFLFAALVATLILIATHLLGPKIKDPAKMRPYECGPEPQGTPRHQFSVHFYIIAIFFILFDIEAVFMYPWAVMFKKFLILQGFVIILDMVVFIGILAVGFIYIWKKKALEWDL
ncbi:MAG: NADH-quinone oxidoreductase subunit A [Deltaproteobacteria bacterium]|nr:NADH-quinone oxidoreductase subunit A [Deltaproteobacteria bacterium]